MTEEQISYLQDRLRTQDLETIKDKNLSKHICLKDPNLGFMLAATIGICGIDRIYKGDFILAFIKFLLFFSFTIILLMAMTEIKVVEKIYSLFFHRSDGLIAFLCFLFLGFLLTIIYVIELFAIANGIRKENYKKVLAYIEGYDKK
ncbi:TM2 domain-containing protein [Campylobacter sp. RM12642]|uniref:TM2 domain-containing protein n=2 Tax=unclassified Campylobacter TaxID=2593542 RepID=UPI003014C2B5|nr:TM2 domain-containing protein [Campylobacter sp. RM12642]